ncbi:MAG TPA: NTP transferase domain-containing protein [Candidatus Limnocylindrales bacterium]|nr:NTP transferase domain-containing protein [Candidatus Limnocylindrales bacterium]
MSPDAGGPDPAGGQGLVSGIVLAGGRGERLGGDKLRLALDGRPLLQHAILSLLPIVDRIVVAGPAEGQLPELPEDLAGDLVVTRDVRTGLGPLAGAAAGLAAAEEVRALIVGGDQVALRPELLAGLLGAAGGSSPAALVLAEEDGWRPLPCVVVRAPALALARRRLDGPHRSLRGWLEALGPTVVDETVWRAWDPDATWQADVDTPDDLARAGRILRAWQGARTGRARS